MSNSLRLMAILAHPDDETLGNGAALARYAAEGAEVSLVTATRGERGWFGAPEDDPGPDALGQLRESELMAAARTLGLHRVDFLDYIDGDLDRADPLEATRRIVRHIVRARPQVVVTFGLDGAYGHPDHIAIAQLTTAAIISAAPSHRVDKLYHMLLTRQRMAAYTAAFGDISMLIDGVERTINPAPDWMVTTRIDAGEHWPTVWRAVTCHRSQLPLYERLERMSDAERRYLWGQLEYQRVFSLVNGGRTVETDLFEGLRTSPRAPLAGVSGGRP